QTMAESVSSFYNFKGAVQSGQFQDLLDRRRRIEQAHRHTAVMAARSMSAAIAVAIVAGRPFVDSNERRQPATVHEFRLSEVDLDGLEGGGGQGGADPIPKCFGIRLT